MTTDLVSYLGDSTGNAGYSSLDAQRVLRVPGAALVHGNVRSNAGINRLLALESVLETLYGLSGGSLDDSAGGELTAAASESSASGRLFTFSYPSD